MVISIIVGLCIWFVVPILFKGNVKKKNREALNMLCRIIGIVIIAWAILNSLS